MASFAIPADVKACSWCSPDGRYSGRFNPSGKFGLAYEKEAKVRMNPEDWHDTSPLYAARLFVGFNVGNKQMWTMEDLVKLVKRVRIRQVGMPDHSVVYQMGVFTSPKTGKHTTENGGQIIILNLPEFTKPKDKPKEKAIFRAQMVALADNICKEMFQESVIVEMQTNGTRTETIGVISEEAMEKKKKMSTIETD